MMSLICVSLRLMTIDACNDNKITPKILKAYTILLTALIFFQSAGIDAQALMKASSAAI